MYHCNITRQHDQSSTVRDERSAAVNDLSEDGRLLQVVLHPKSIYQVSGVWHGVAQLNGFHPGVDLLRGEEAREEVLDRVRFFAEDCDSLQVGIEQGLLYTSHVSSNCTRTVYARTEARRPASQVVQFLKL
jgi:hypothetical protein